MPHAINRLLVFCGSASGNNDTYTRAAKDLGNVMAQHNSTLIYGAAQVGVMGALANAVLANHGKVIGIIPHFLKTKEVAHEGLSEMIVVDTMHERKNKMYELCDAALVLPGGYGTMDEFFEFLTWAQLGLHQKPICIWNFQGYYDMLLAQMDKMVAEGFLSLSNRSLIVVAHTLDEIFPAMQLYNAGAKPKWMQEGDQ